MARNEARLYSTIWDDEDFIAEDELAQRAYLFLLSQNDLGHSGVLPLRVSRWARKGPKLTAEDWRQHLTQLGQRRFVVVDWETEEVLIRSLMRNDRTFKEPNVMRSAIKQVKSIESQAIIRELCAEVARIREENPDLTVQQSAALAEMEDALAAKFPTPKRTSSERPSTDPTEKGSEKGSANPSAMTTAKRLGGEGSVTAVVSESPLPFAPALPPPAGDASPPPRAELAVVPDPGPEPRTAQEIVGWYIDRCDERPPKQIIGQLAKTIAGLLEEGIQPARIRQGIADWAVKGQHPSALASFVNAAMNRRAPIRAAPEPPRQSTTNRAVNEALALAARLEAQGGPQ